MSRRSLNSSQRNDNLEASPSSLNNELQDTDLLSFLLQPRSQIYGTALGNVSRDHTTSSKPHLPCDKEGNSSFLGTFRTGASQRISLETAEPPKRTEHRFISSSMGKVEAPQINGRGREPQKKGTMAIPKKRASSQNGKIEVVKVAKLDNKTGRFKASVIAKDKPQAHNKMSKPQESVDDSEDDLPIRFRRTKRRGKESSLQRAGPSTSPNNVGNGNLSDRTPSAVEKSAIGQRFSKTGSNQGELRAPYQRVQELEKELGLVKAAHSQELSALQAKSKCEQQKMKEQDQKISELERALKDAEAKNIEVEASTRSMGDQIKGLKGQNQELSIALKDEKNKQPSQSALKLKNLALETKNRDLEAALRKEREEHGDLMRSLDERGANGGKHAPSSKETSEQISALQRENDSIRQELDFLKQRTNSTPSPSPSTAPYPSPTSGVHSSSKSTDKSSSSSIPSHISTSRPGPSSTSACSPAPTSSSTSTSAQDLQTRLDNVRATFLGFKKHYDRIRAASDRLITCTTGMDLTSFGEFGAYLTKLKRVIEKPVEEDI